MDANNKYLSNDKDLISNLPEESSVTEPTISSKPNEQQLPNFIINNDKILGEALGNQFANTMAEDGFHPVLIFGAPASGKTTFLLSLIRYMFVGQNCDSQIRLCLEPFPNESTGVKVEHKDLDRERWTAVKKYANDLFNKHATDFLQSNQIAPRTEVKFPFFIPIEITPKKEGLKPLKIAFLEGEGEWYRLNTDGESTSPHKTFRHEILAFLERYPHPITSIFVAPFAIDGYESNQDGESSRSAPKVKERDFALYGIIDQFEKARTNQIGSDNYLYLLTKWDIRCGSISHPEFIYKDFSVVKNEINSKFPMSLNRFNNIREGEPVKIKGKIVVNSKKTVSAYCAGILRYAVLSLPEESTRSVDHYSRKLWNYLYLNATNQNLYSEFAPMKVGFFERIINWIKK
jgi:hypothetical protein